jgi:hypothetical protein
MEGFDKRLCKVQVARFIDGYGKLASNSLEKLGSFKRSLPAWDAKESFKETITRPRNDAGPCLESKTIFDAFRMGWRQIIANMQN